MSEIQKLEEIDPRTPMTTARMFQDMFRDASKVASAAAEVDLRKIKKMSDFLTYAEENGFSTPDLVQKLELAFELARENQDTRALARLTEVMVKLFLEPSNEFGRMINQIHQTNIKMEAKEGKESAHDVQGLLNSLPEAEVKKFILEKMKQFVEE